MPRELLPCGTYAAFQRHVKAGEAPCDACREARNAYQSNWHGGRVVPKERAWCGTVGGYHAHRYRRQRACRACLDAHAAAERERRAARAGDQKP